MANHNRGYYRRMRAKHIRRKKRIVNAYHGYWYYSSDGMYSKGKIHCSCPMCSQKTNNKGKNRLKHGNYYPSKNWKHSDRIKIERMNFQLKDFD